MDPKAFVDGLREAGVSFFAGVPDSYLHGFCSELQASCAPGMNLIAANEGNAVAIAAGRYLATGSVPLIYLQNSGLGNAVNPLASLACEGMLGIPMILLIGWRGDPWHADHVQHRLQGRITPSMLGELGIPYSILGEGDPAGYAAWAAREAARRSAPVALLSPKGVLNGTKKPSADAGYPLSREEAIAAVLDAAPREAVFSATTGRASRELYHLREARGESHGRDYLNVGSMGHASSVALGIAISAPGRPVVCLDGDAAAIMHLGALTMASKVDVPNLLHIVLNNGEHESVGGQPSAGQRVDLTGVAAACGYETVGGPVSEASEIASSVRDLLSRPGAGFLDVRVHPGIRADLPPLEIDPEGMRDSLRATLGGRG